MKFSEVNLTPKQSLLLHPDNYATEILCGGAAGGGKSLLLRIIAIYYSLQIPYLQTYLFRKNYNDLRTNHLEGEAGFISLLSELTDSGNAKINFSEMTIKFNNGSNIYLRHLDTEKAKYNLQGAEIGLLLIDEATMISSTQYEFLRSRCRMGSTKVPDKFQHLFPRIIASSNPGNISHNYFKAEFIDIQPEFEIDRMPPEKGGFYRQYVPFSLDDNPHIDEDYENALYGLGDEELIKAMRYGSWDIAQGSALADVWDRDKDVISPFRIPESWNVTRGMDWGTSKPYAVLWIAESNGEEFQDDDGNIRYFPKGTKIIINELYGMKHGKPNTGTDELPSVVAKNIKEIENNSSLLKHLKVKAGPADRSMWSERDGRGGFLIDYFKKEGVRFEPSYKASGSRIGGLNAIRTRLRNNKISGEAGLYIFQNCIHCIRTLPTIPRDTKNFEDVDTNAEDHCYDVIRYNLFQKKVEYKTFDRFKRA